MSEMEDTADHVIVIGRGKLIADMPLQKFMESSSRHLVRVVSPDAERFSSLLDKNGASVQKDGDRTLVVAGIDAPHIGELAAANAIVLHELAPERESLESAFIELTRGSVEYQFEDQQKKRGARGDRRR